MNFQDLFARYREMGAMAPQQSFDEQLFIRNQNMPPNSWALSSDPIKMDLPSTQDKDNDETKKEHLMFKLPSPNTFRPFLMSMEEEHKQGLSGDEEVEELLQPPPTETQQGWNLGLLKRNSLCKEYYKLTSNVLHTIIMGIKEFADGDISPAWQIAQDRGHQKHSSFSNAFLQDVGGKSTAMNESNPKSSVPDGSIEDKISVEPSIGVGNKSGSPIKSSPNNKTGGQAPALKEMTERMKDIDSILELRKLLWRQIVPYTCLGTTLDPKQDGEKKMKLVQETRMKVVNAGGFGLNSETYNCNFPETCQVSFKGGLQPIAPREIEPEIQMYPGTPCMKDEQRASPPGQTLRRMEGMEREFFEQERVEEKEHDISKSHKEDPEQGANQTEYSVSFPEEDVDMQIEEEYANSREVKDTQPLKRSKVSADRGTKFDQKNSSRSNFHAKETRFSIDGQILPIFDEEFEIIGDEKETPFRYPGENFVSCKRGGDDSVRNNLVDKQLQVVNRDDKDIRQGSVTQYKEVLVPSKSTTRSWCIVGGFSSKSQPTLRNKHSHSQKPTKPLQV